MAALANWYSHLDVTCGNDGETPKLLKQPMESKCEGNVTEGRAEQYRETTLDLH